MCALLNRRIVKNCIRQKYIQVTNIKKKIYFNLDFKFVKYFESAVLVIKTHKQPAGIAELQLFLLSVLSLLKG